MFNFDSFSIRPIKAEDQDCILHWRNLERVRTNMYSDHIISQQEHEAWFARALIENFSYLIFLYERRPIGCASFTNISVEHDRCYWAFYLGETDVPRGCGSVMEFLLLDYAFLTLKIRKLCCEVFAFNAGVIKLHEKFGFVQEGRFLEHYKKNGKYEDIVCLAKFATSWAEERKVFKSRLFGN